MNKLRREHHNNFDSQFEKSCASSTSSNRHVSTQEARSIQGRFEVQTVTYLKFSYIGRSHCLRLGVVTEVVLVTVIRLVFADFYGFASQALALNDSLYSRYNVGCGSELATWERLPGLFVTQICLNNPW